VWAGGTAVFQFTITNQDSSFCSKSQFDLALNNPSTLRNMGFDWYFNPMNAALDPGASSNSYLLITTPKDLDSPLNVTLSVNVSSFDSNTQILYSVRFETEISTFCSTLNIFQISLCLFVVNDYSDYSH
jgi:hypothetical protein